MKKGFDIYNYLHNNNIDLKISKPKNATHVAKGYNDIRKTLLHEIKITDGKFNLKENLEGDKPALSNEAKRQFLEIISTYNKYQDQMKRQSDMSEIADTLGAIVDAVKELTSNTNEDWFDGVTIKRNMGELDKLDKQFQKFAADAKLMDERLHALYEDMGHLIGRYYQISDLDEETMKSRLAIKESELKTEGTTPMVGSYVKYYEFENGKKYPWYITYIDSTHVNLSMKEPNTPNSGGNGVYHIGQLRDAPIYNLMKKWMETGDTKGIMNKTVVGKVFNEAVRKPKSKFKSIMLK